MGQRRGPGPGCHGPRTARVRSGGRRETGRCETREQRGTCGVQMAGSTWANPSDAALGSIGTVFRTQARVRWSWCSSAGSTWSTFCVRRDCRRWRRTPCMSCPTRLIASRWRNGPYRTALTWVNSSTGWAAAHDAVRYDPRPGASSVLASIRLVGPCGPTASAGGLGGAKTSVNRGDSR